MTSSATNSDAAGNYHLTWYNLSNALWMGSFSIQQLLVIWILVGVLEQSPETVGIVQLLIGIPGLVFMLWGGFIGDRVDGRQLLIQTHLLSAIPPLCLVVIISYGQLGLASVIVFALSANLLNSASNPARNTILNKVAKSRLQYAIGLSTGIGSVATMIGTRVAGEIESIGLFNILIFQAVFFVVGAIALLGLPKYPVVKQSSKAETTQHLDEAPTASMLSTIKNGLLYTWRFKLARDLVALNFFSSFFNAGAWLVAIPFIISRVYQGDALLLANITVIFYFGSLIANFGLLRFMPLARPGRLYLIMQLSRIFVLLLIWIQPHISVFWFAAAYWGFNMGVTNTTSRLMVQEIALPEYRSRLMSVYTLGLMSAAPVGSLVLGFVIGQFGSLNALIPGMISSVIIFWIGYHYTAIWQYKSPTEPVYK